MALSLEATWNFLIEGGIRGKITVRHTSYPRQPFDWNKRESTTLHKWSVIVFVDLSSRQYCIFELIIVTREIGSDFTKIGANFWHDVTTGRALLLERARAAARARVSAMRALFKNLNSQPSQSVPHKRNKMVRTRRGKSTTPRSLEV